MHLIIRNRKTVQNKCYTVSIFFKIEFYGLKAMEGNSSMTGKGYYLGNISLSHIDT